MGCVKVRGAVELSGEHTGLERLARVMEARRVVAQVAVGLGVPLSAVVRLLDWFG